MNYRAFVSSTFADLKDHRAHIISTLRKSGMSVDPMEDWTAATDEPIHFSQERVEGCDLCILLVGFRRGHVPKDSTLSITQLEYKTAVELGIDVLVFMLDEEAAWPRKFDDLEKDPQLRQWRSALLEQRGVAFFNHEPKSIDIASALTRWITKKTQADSTLQLDSDLSQDQKQIKATFPIAKQALPDEITSETNKEKPPNKERLTKICAGKWRIRPVDPVMHQISAMVPNNFEITLQEDQSCSGIFQISNPMIGVISFNANGEWEFDDKSQSFQLRLTLTEGGIESRNPLKAMLGRIPKNILPQMNLQQYTILSGEHGYFKAIDNEGKNYRIEMLS
jgi:hypothetical protein